MAQHDPSYIPPMRENINNASETKADNNNFPAFPMQPPPPPPPYAAQASPMQAFPGAQSHPSMHPIFVTPVQTIYQPTILPYNYMPPQTAHIRDYMVWSIINVFVGVLFLGYIAIFCSVKTKERKRQGNVERATRMSRITLIYNIIVTLTGIGITAFLIVYNIQNINKHYKLYT